MSIDVSASGLHFISMLWASFVTRVLTPIVAFIEAAWPNAYWNVGYLIFIFWMYLFHAPFRVHSKARTDWYAQVTKTMQVWCGITITLFHLAPRYMELHRARSVDGDAGHNGVAGNPGGVFFPCVAAFLFWFLVLHRYKRLFDFKVTYAATPTILFLNALLVALFLTVHYTYCEHNAAAESMPLWFSDWVSTALPQWLALVITSIAAMCVQSNHTFWDAACPNTFEGAPFSTITHLVVCGLLFVAVDYWYKRGRGYDAVRGILWCEAVTPLPGNGALQSALKRSTSKGESSPKRSVNTSAVACGKKTKAPAGAPGSPLLGVDDSSDEEADQKLQPDNPPSMVPWFSTLIAHTAFQLFIGSNLNFLSFDYRGIERSLTPKIFRVIPILCARKLLLNDAPSGGSTSISSEAARARKECKKAAEAPRVETAKGKDEEASELWFDWVADVGDGFNSTYGIARLLAQPELQVSIPQAAQLRRHQRVARRISQAVRNVRQTGYTLRDTFLHSTATLKHSFSSTMLSSDVRTRHPSDRQRPGRDSLAPLERSAARRSASAEQPRSRSSRARGAPVLNSPRTTEDLQQCDDDTDVLTPLSATISTSRRFLFGSPSAMEESPSVDLPRGAFVLNGGDLAYPNPTDETYEQRLFSPYRDALGPCPKLRASMQTSKESFVERQTRRAGVGGEVEGDEDVAVIRTLSTDAALDHFSQRAARAQKPTTSEKEQSDDNAVVLHSTPFLLSIPGNHDWIDGLTTFRNYIIGKSWLGGWFLPQRSSYFVVELPGNWFFLCLDAGLSNDIDTEQLAYFMDVIERRMDALSCVALCSHEPVWIYDSYHLRKEETVEKRMYKLCRKLGRRLRMRLCGDVHNYSRHVAADDAPMLVVSGGGGAFLHGPRTTPVVHLGHHYTSACSFPSHASVVNFATRLFGFRIVNWQFDFIGGLLYFAIIFSTLPIPIHHQDGTSLVPTTHSPMELLRSVLMLTWRLVAHIFTVSHFSCVVCTSCVIIMIGVIEDKVPFPKRILYGVTWAALHIFAAVGLVALMHCLLSFVYASRMVSSRAGEWRSSMETQVADAIQYLVQGTLVALRDRYEWHATFNLEAAMQWLQSSAFTTWPKVLLRSVDVVEGMTYLATSVTAASCTLSNGTIASADTVFGQFAPSATRVEILLYYAHAVWFYWILATPVVSFVVGAFLLFSVRVTDTAYDPAHSAFQIEDYKHFLRFRLDPKTRELHCYVVGMDRVPKQWARDPQCVRQHSKMAVAPLKDGGHYVPPHLQQHPSVWKPNDELWRVPGERRHTAPRLIEEFTVCPHTL